MFYNKIGDKIKNIKTKLTKSFSKSEKTSLICLENYPELKKNYRNLS